jgi:hypothetical protein
METHMKRKNAFLFIFLAIVLVLAACKPKAEVTPLSAALSELTGTVDTKRAGEETFLPASADTVLDVNGQVQTGDDGRVRLDLSSGTIIRVGPSTFFTLIGNDEVEGGLATRIKLDIGKVFIILNGGSADVETPSGVASVRGSYMKVEVNPETLDIYITCLEGDCSASNPAGSASFTNGQKVILFHRDPVTGNWSPPNVEPMTPEEFQEWLDNNPEAKELFEQAMATVTALAQPTQAPTSTVTPTATLEQAAPPAGASTACFKLISPQNGAALPKQGPVNFSWEAHNGAQRYVVTFENANGYRATINATGTSITSYIEVFAGGTSYSWFVTSYGAAGNELCSTPSNSFTKPASDPTPKPPPPTDEAPACTANDYCDGNSSCYNVEFCECGPLGCGNGNGNEQPYCYFENICLNNYEDGCYNPTDPYWCGEG